MSLAYLGTPYTRYKAGLRQAYVDAARLAARLVKAGVAAYSPIVHCHPISAYGELDPLDLSIWYPHNGLMMQRCDALIVAHMDGWEESAGIKYEVAFFEERKRPIFDLDTETLRMDRRK